MFNKLKENAGRISAVATGLMVTGVAVVSGAVFAAPPTPSEILTDAFTDIVAEILLIVGNLLPVLAGLLGFFIALAVVLRLTRRFAR